MFRNKSERLRVGIIGCGVSNLGVVEYLSSIGIPYSLTVRSKSAPSKLPKEAFIERILTGGAHLSDIDEDVLFLSPTARRDTPEILLAAARGTKILSDAELFFSIVKKPVLTVTGTDGKSTTATIAQKLLCAGGLNAELCGNIGKSLSQSLKAHATDVFVTELSSFQLMSFTPKSRSAVITNISENHLDWHKSMEEYIGAKENALRCAERRIICADSPLCIPLIKKYGADIVYSTKLSDEELLAFSTPNRLSRSGGYILKNGKPYLSEAGILLTQEHFLADYLAAIALVGDSLSEKDFYSVSSSFRGLDHRARLVGTYGGVDFIDSSIDSTPARTLATLRSMKSRVILILGGRGKNLSYDELLLNLTRYARAVILTGEIGKGLYQLIESNESVKTDLISVYERKFDDAVRVAARIAAPGETVLLSPAATSLDAFESYKARGERFAELAKTVIIKEKT